jgi:hypothetical protein
MNRYDRVDPPKNMSSKFEKTDEGYLKGIAPVCSVGVYQYMDGAGNTYGELRLPEEVFKQDFLDSLKGAVLTLLHPTEFVTDENIDRYKVGELGTGVKTDDGIHVATEILITDSTAIAAVMSGIQELSVGYTCDHEEASGVWCGMRYDRIQRNLRANHVSLVPSARGGETLRIRLDSADSAVLVINSEKEATMPELKNVKLDGVEYQAEARVIEAMHKATERADTVQVVLDETKAKFDALTAEKTKLEAERDNLKDGLDKANAKVTELENARMDEAAITAAVNRRVKILDAAKTAGVEVKEDMSELDIQKAVIMAVFPKANLDGKDVTYIDARFDGAIESFELNADADNRQAAGADVARNDGADAEVKVDADAARARMIENLKNGYKKEA